MAAVSLTVRKRVNHEVTKDTKLPRRTVTEHPDRWLLKSRHLPKLRIVSPELRLTVSAFHEGAPPAHFARFCFAKTDTAIDEAVARLGRFFGK